jgi:LIM domain
VNGSLCAAPSCGKPIEGPCAVSHAGDKYHPDHLVCDYPRCTERLEEYWEVDGRMLCEMHMQMEEDVVIRGGKDLVDDMLMELGVKPENLRNSIRAMKRVTRFIDIAGLGSNAAG